VSNHAEHVIDIVRTVVNHDRLSSYSWDSFSLIVQVSPGKVQMNGYRYIGDAPAQPTNVGSRHLFEDFVRLREELVSADGEKWEIAILKVENESGRYSMDFVSPQDAGSWRVNPSTFWRVAEAAKPTSEDFSRGPRK
jgi:hypothetical protein